MTKGEAFKEINETQDHYINELIDLMKSEKHKSFKTIDFTSPTGTGKTMMMSKLANLMPDKFFIITTLSKGQLNIQIRNNLKELIKQDNFIVYGSCDFTKNTKLQAKDILNKLPQDKDIVWLRDEGHIKTNNFEKLLADKCYKVINFSATNMKSDIKCNFTNTMMLRTPKQQTGTPEDAIAKLLEIKEIHKHVKDYNPCAIFRCIDNRTLLQNIIDLCEKNNLKYINITTEDFDMSDLCRDDNEYDVIINKFKIVEGIDIRRAHVLYMDNKPSSNATTIQVIGRCRRNALLYRKDIDILDKKNKDLLNETRKCYIYYNVEKMNIESDENGELAYALCDKISVEKLKADSIIEVENGRLFNGLEVIELEGETGKFQILKDKETGFNIVKPEGVFYNEEISEPNFFDDVILVDKEFYRLSDLYKLKRFTTKIKVKFDYSTGQYEEEEREVINLYEKDTYVLSKDKVNFILDYISKNFYITDSNKKCKTKAGKNNKGSTKCVNYRAYIPKIKTVIPQFIKKYSNKELSSDDINNELLGRGYKDFSSRDEAEEYLRSSLSLALSLLDDFFKRDSDSIVQWYKINHINSEVGSMKLYKKGRLSINNNVAPGDIIDEVFKEFDRIKRGLPKLNTVIGPASLTGNYKLIETSTIPAYFKSYLKIFNDRHSAIIGTEDMRPINDKWVESKAVTNKVKNFCKFNTYIENQYASQLLASKDKLFKGKNNFKFDKKCNSCLGYCVEYYSKYKVYGRSYLATFIDKAQYESQTIIENEGIIVRACMLKYKEVIRKCYGQYVARKIQTISIDKLIHESYKEFVDTVVELGTKAAEFIKETLYKGTTPRDDIDPNLCIKHISGLADYITEDTILDIKTTNEISKDMLKQVLAYHYLSTKRTDLNIKRVIVYDTVSGRNVTIDL